MTPNQIISLWAIAEVEAEKNPSLMLASRPVNFKATQEFCIRQMQELEKATLRLLSLEGQSDLPLPLLVFFEANNDKGCDSCWLSSRKGKNHPDCNIKIDQWFDARDKLTAYGLDNIESK